MSYTSSFPRCALEIGASRSVLLFSIALATFAVAAPWLAGLPWWLALGADACAIPATLGFVRWSCSEVRRLVWQADGRWQLVDARGARHDQLRLLPGAWTASRFLALRWQCDECGERFHAVLLHDNTDADELRRLAARLRLTPDAQLFVHQSGQRTLDAPAAKLPGTSTVSRGDCRSSRSG